MLGHQGHGAACAGRAPPTTLVKALKEETGLPVHFHTHDTSGIAAASVLAAIEAGADAVDGAMDAHERAHLAAEPGLDRRGAALRRRAIPASIRTQLRTISALLGAGAPGCYAAFESDIRAGASEVYVHGMPGGQYTNLREQARALGIDDDALAGSVARTYADVNDMFGDIVKVTPTSKVVGDMALLMVTSGLTRAAGARSGHRDRVSGVGGAAVPRRARPAATAASRRRCSARC